MIRVNTGDDILVSLMLYVPHEKFRIDKEYSPGDIVWYNEVYYEYQNVAASTGTLPSDSSVWTALAGRKKYDTQYITKMIIHFHYQGTREPIFKFSINAMAGYGTINTAAIASSIVSCEILAADTTKKKEGVIVATVKFVENLPVVGEKTRTEPDIPCFVFNNPSTEFITPL